MEFSPIGLGASSEGGVDADRGGLVLAHRGDLPAVDSGHRAPHDVDQVVTERGVAELLGKTERERVDALVAC